MRSREGLIRPEPLDAAIDEYKAVFSPAWKPGTLSNYTCEFRSFRDWIAAQPGVHRS